MAVGLVLVAVMVNNGADRPRPPTPPTQTSRSKHARVERLRRRLQNVPEGNPATEGLIDIVKGLLDLLDDELL